MVLLVMPDRAIKALVICSWLQKIAKKSCHVLKEFVWI
jgi:hypothetical protein